MLGLAGAKVHECRIFSFTGTEVCHHPRADWQNHPQACKKIIVFKAEKVDGYRQQRIQMIYNAIGAVEIPNEKEAA